MNHHRDPGLICLLLLICLVGSCIADELPTSLAYLQGEKSTITAGSDGIYEISVNSPVPYFSLANGDTNRLIPINVLTSMPYPLNAALFFIEEKNETTAIVTVTNISFSEDNKTLILQVKPLEFYEGTQLKSFNDTKVPLDQVERSQSMVGVYLEINQKIPTNEDASTCYNNCVAERICAQVCYCNCYGYFCSDYQIPDPNPIVDDYV